MNASVREVCTAKIDEKALNEASYSGLAMKLFQRGSYLNSSQVKALFRRLSSNNCELSIRTALLGYYASRCHLSSEQTDAYSQLLSWFIQHFPSALVTQSCRYDKSDSTFFKLLKEWQRTTKILKDDPSLFAHIADFSSVVNYSLAVKYWKKAQSIQPSLDVSSKLARHYFHHIGELKETRSKKVVAESAIAEWRKVIWFARKEFPESPLVIQNWTIEFAELSIKFSSWNSAEELSKFLLSFNKDDPYLRIKSLSLLGRVALNKGHLKDAVKYLKQIEHVYGESFVLKDFPDIGLASELISHGEVEIAHGYFLFLKDRMALLLNGEISQRSSSEQRSLISRKYRSLERVVRMISNGERPSNLEFLTR